MEIINKVSLMLICVAAISCSNMINDQKGHAPGQVKLTALSTDTASITMTWTDPSDSSLAYETVTCNSTETKVAKGVCTCTVSGLTSGTDYAVEITSYSSAGRSSEALTFSATTTSSGTRTYYLIYTAEDMYNVRNDLAGYYLLMSDISLSAYSNWTPIGLVTDRFIGTFDGNGHVISGLTINSSSSDSQGLFGWMSGIIKNIGLKHISVSGSSTYIGTLAGVNYFGTISNCYATGTVSGSSSAEYVGGLVGTNEGTIKFSYATVTVSGSYNIVIGGLVGDNLAGGISNCYATGSVSGGDEVGGLVGNNNGEISNSYATGFVSGGDEVGGLVGMNLSTPPTFCYYDSTTTGCTSGEGTAMTTAQMKLQDSSTVCGTDIYVDWDFSTVWGVSGSINSGYPYLLDNAPE